MPTRKNPRPHGAGRPRKSDASTADTEARVLEAAKRVFIRRGTAGARMQEIAAEAGVTRTLVHYYFHSKDALAERVFLDVARSAFATLVPPAETGMSLESLIDTLVGGYITAVRHAPFIPGFLLAEAQQHPERLEHLLRAAIGTGPSEIAGVMLRRIDGMVSAHVRDGTLASMATQQLLINVMALAVFPFVARPVLNAALGCDEARFEHFHNERRHQHPAFIWGSPS